MSDFIKGVWFGCICILIAMLFQYFWSGDTSVNEEERDYSFVVHNLEKLKPFFIDECESGCNIYEYHAANDTMQVYIHDSEEGKLIQKCYDTCKTLW